MTSAIADAKKLRTPWTRVAQAVRQGMEAAEAKAGQSGAVGFLKEASAASAYSVNVLKRFAVVAAFVEQTADARKLPADLLDHSFTKLEIVSRIYAKNRERGRELIRSLKDSTTSVARLKSELKRLSAAPVILTDASGPARSTPAANLASARSWRKAYAFGRLGEIVSKLSGPTRMLDRPRGNPDAFRCDAVAWFDDEYREADGFEIAYAPRELGRAALIDLVSRALVAGSFFRKFFVIFTDDSSKTMADAAVQILKKLGARNVGVVRLEGPGSYEILATPIGTPNPDRRGQLSEFLPEGRWA